MPGIREAVQWIADNDEPEEMDREIVSGFISVQLVADLFRKDPMDIAHRVVNERMRQQLVEVLLKDRRANA